MKRTSIGRDPWICEDVYNWVSFLSQNVVIWLHWRPGFLTLLHEHAFSFLLAYVAVLRLLGIDSGQSDCTGLYHNDYRVADVREVAPTSCGGHKYLRSKAIVLEGVTGGCEKGQI